MKKKLKAALKTAGKVALVPVQIIMAAVVLKNQGD